MKKKNIETIEWTRVNNDSNGNPRYVCHYSTLLTEKDREELGYGRIQEDYSLALQRAKKIGGKKFNNKQFGGGIVFQSYESDPQRDGAIAKLLQSYN